MNNVRLHHFLLALTVHALLLIFLLVGAQCTRKPEAPQIIEGVIVNEAINKPAPTPPSRDTPPTPEPKPKADEVQQQIQQQRIKQQAEQRQQQELQQKQQQQQREAQAQAKREAEQKAREAELAKQQADAKEKAEQQEAKRRADEAQKQAQAEEKQRQQAALDAKKKADAEKRAQEEQQRKAAAEEKRREAELAKALGAEEQAREIGQVQQTWALQITDAIQNAWVRPPGTDLSLTCKVKIHVLPNGQVTAAQVTRGSGNPLFDDSVITAVYKASPLPQPSDPAAFVPDISITFVPK